MCLSAQTFKLLPVPHRQHCPPTLAQKHSAAWVFSLAITAGEFAVTDEKIAFPKKKKMREREKTCFSSHQAVSSLAQGGTASRPNTERRENMTD